jgi:Ca-activated chloride channel homolog
VKFGQPLFLALVLVPLGICLYSFFRSSKPWRSILKALSAAAILFALAEPHLTIPETRHAVVALLDTSASITEQGLEKAKTLVRQMEQERGRNWFRVFPFDSQIESGGDPQHNRVVDFKRISDGSANATNLEKALQSVMAAAPAGYVPNVVVLSDGNENEGSVLRSLAQLQSLGIPVDTIPIGGSAVSGLRIRAVSLPRRAFSDEQIPIDLTIDATKASTASIDIVAEDKKLGQQAVRLERGQNNVRVTVRVKSTGIVSIGGTIRSPGFADAHFEQAIKLARAHVLYISDDPAGTDANLLAAFNQANIEITRDITDIDRDLDRFQLVVLNNIDLASISPIRKQRVEAYVKSGGGLLLIGGERQVYKEDKQLDALDRALPAKLAPPDSPKGICVALIIDKSSSMEGRKIELARLSAIGVVDHLQPKDSIGVLIFDNSYQWAVPMRRAEDKSLIKRLISGITPDGGTQIAPALAEAYHHVAPSTATFKHIVLLTDGISEEGDSIEVAKEASQHDVTISTVGLGQDVNRSYLEKVATTSGGRSYFLNDPMGLEQILLKDVEAYSGSTAVERALLPIVADKADVLADVGMDSAPPLRGYARYKAKPGTEVPLQIDAAKKDPLYVRWQYGLGRSAVFASDAKSRWAEAWMNWPGFDKFWINVSRDLLMLNRPSEGTASFDSANDELVVHYKLSDKLAENTKVPALFVLGANGFRKALEVRKVADGVYEGRLKIGSQTGLFRVRPLEESIAFPEVGFYRPQPEFENLPVNVDLLKTLSNFTGGRYDPNPSQVFQSNGRSSQTDWQLWPVFLGLAIAFTIAELMMRKWDGLKARLGAWAHSSR